MFMITVMMKMLLRMMRNCRVAVCSLPPPCPANFVRPILGERLPPAWQTGHHGNHDHDDCGGGNGGDRGIVMMKEATWNWVWCKIYYLGAMRRIFNDVTPGVKNSHTRTSASGHPTFQLLEYAIPSSGLSYPHILWLKDYKSRIHARPGTVWTKLTS